MYIVTLIIFQKSQNKNHPLIKHTKEKETIKEFFTNLKTYITSKELMKASSVAFGVAYFFGIFSIYAPLYIINKGYTDNIVGWVLAGSVIPLVLLEVWVGKLADKHGIRRYIAFGFITMAIITVLFQVITIVPVVLFLMAFVNVGLAFIEPLKETYFFKVVDKKNEEKYYGIYNVSRNIANVIAPLIGALTLTIFGMAGLWYGLAIALFIFFIISLTIKK